MTTHRAKFPYYTAMRQYQGNTPVLVTEPAVSFSRHISREGFRDCGNFTRNRFEKPACLLSRSTDGGRRMITVPETLSPFARWKKDNGVGTFYADHLSAEEMPWCAFPPGKQWDSANPELCGYGETELEACYDLAKIHGLVWFQTGKIAQ